MSKKQQTKKQISSSKRAIDALFEEYTAFYQNSVNRKLQWIAIPLIFFGISGLVWLMPFPSLPFLGKYNGFINWFTILMAFTIYYYLRLAPTLSYAMLFTFGAFSYLIVQLEFAHKQGGAHPLVPCVAIFVIGLILFFIGARREGKSASFKTKLKLLLIAPLWLWHLVFDKLKLPY